ncbi:hypothetical protein FACS1894125_4440 [Actinomycetota bacterium]|nr:hypothetical protein FACS1894125_4440 [Actinomycetota bacterium]
MVEKKQTTAGKKSAAGKKTVAKKTTTASAKSASAKKSAAAKVVDPATKAQDDVVAKKSTTKSVVAKKKPTPKRKDAEAKNIRPLVQDKKAPKKELSKEEKAQLKEKQRTEANALREKQNAALQSGDQKHLPERDKGEVRKYVRELVDEKHNPAEYFLPIVIVVILASLFLNGVDYRASFALTIAVYGYLIVAGIYLFFKVRKIKGKVNEKFTSTKYDDEKRGVGSYALNRMTQPRKLRLPKVGV